MLGDMQTPVGVYLKVRDKFPNSFLLESSDYHGKENSFSYIGLDELASFSTDEEKLLIKYPDGNQESKKTTKIIVLDELKQFMNAFQSESDNLKFIKNGLFGYASYESVSFFEDIKFNANKASDYKLPLMHYTLFKFVIAFDHFNNKICITENTINQEETDPGQLSRLLALIDAQNTPTFSFESSGKIDSNISDEVYKSMVEKGIEHCKKGDTFQLVLSKSFSTTFKGDDFQVYRALRSVNPSPYLFYFDYGTFKIFGSSPEAQLVVKDNKASIHPIAGTYKRSGDDRHDYDMAKKLSEDEKEIAEHVMLVDLARNDLSKSGDGVEVEVFKEVQYFSHVIHLVSKVTAQLKKGMLDVAADTFPAGTLSGAPKYRAMELIDEYEGTKRGFYGGMIGFMDFNGNFNHAIIIRSFLSQNNKLHFRAGAGIVAKSNPENELQEVYNKTGALVKAIEMANNLEN